MTGRALPRLLVDVVVLAAVAAAVFVLASPPRPVRVVRMAPAAEETIYIRNLAPQFDPGSRIRRQIPVWERAANGAFRAVWHTPRVKLVYLGRRRAPRGALVALFVSSGPAEGALAYHTQTAGQPQIVVYSGTNAYYGFSTSVSFTHELFETLADEHTASINQGWPYPFVTFSGGQWGRSFLLPTPPGQLAANEVCDPVEEDYYWSDGVAISDWVTPNYFNDHQTVSGGGTYDYMGLVQQPLEIRPGGYQAIYVIDYITPAGETYTGWISLTNFRRQDPAQRGFLDDTGGKAINVDDELSRARR